MSWVPIALVRIAIAKESIFCNAITNAYCERTLTPIDIKFMHNAKSVSHKKKCLKVYCHSSNSIESTSDISRHKHLLRKSGIKNSQIMEMETFTHSSITYNHKCTSYGETIPNKIQQCLNYQYRDQVKHCRQDKGQFFALSSLVCSVCATKSNKCN